MTIRYGASFSSLAALTANTAQAMFSAASNVNGAVVHVASMSSANGTGTPSAAIIAHTSAPTALTMGDDISQAAASHVGTSAFGASRVANDIFIPPGKGVYFIASITESTGRRNGLYTLL